MTFGTTLSPIIRFCFSLIFVYLTNFYLAFQSLWLASQTVWLAPYDPPAGSYYPGTGLSNYIVDLSDPLTASQILGLALETLGNAHRPSG